MTKTRVSPGSATDVPGGYTLQDALDSVGPGWHKIIELLWSCKPEDTEVVQVKEKFGGLRFYTNATTEQFHDLIAVMEWASELVCEKCGSLGQLMQYGWWKTRCPKCEEDYRKKQEELKTQGWKTGTTEEFLDDIQESE